MDKDTIEMYARMFEAGTKRLRDLTLPLPEKISALKTMGHLCETLQAKLEKVQKKNEKKV